MMEIFVYLAKNDFSFIQILKYSEADYSSLDYIVELERAEKQGDGILVTASQLVQQS